MKFYEKLTGKKINFLIGSGASVPLYATLSLGNENPTFEDLITNENISDINKKMLHTLFYNFYILKMKNVNVGLTSEENEHYTVVSNHYNKLVKKIVNFLDRESNEIPKRVNIFTTNYDVLFENAFEIFCKNNKTKCYFNDGSYGFKERYVDNDNFNLSISHTGYHDIFTKEIPTINLLKLHGSVTWVEKNNKVKVEYSTNTDNMELVNETFDINKLIDVLKDVEENFDFTLDDKFSDGHYKQINLKLDEFSSGCSGELIRFYNEHYKKMLIVSPTKEKFNETVFQQHYYQLLRNLSFELEKKDSILIVFGFSFEDEHILNVIQRSILNPTLEIIVICYDENSRNNIKSKFDGLKNVKYLPEKFSNSNGSEFKGNFDYLNNEVLGDLDG